MVSVLTDSAFYVHSYVCETVKELQGILCLWLFYCCIEMKRIPDASLEIMHAEFLDDRITCAGEEDEFAQRKPIQWKTYRTYNFSIGVPGTTTCIIDTD